MDSVEIRHWKRKKRNPDRTALYWRTGDGELFLLDREFMNGRIAHIFKSPISINLIYITRKDEREIFFTIAAGMTR